MNKIAFLAPKKAAAPKPATPPRREQPLKAVQLLLPVWGYGYVRQFLGYGLPTLLAPGNVPALAAALPTELIILTSVDDAEYIRAHKNFRRLAAVCKTEIRPIDHLITDGNYSTTITLAYTEAVRAVGEAMVDTCFFFLVSDYIMADGSLANALKRMQGGASAVIVGNFQITHEDALPWLEQRLAGRKQSLALSPRELMKWALANLHPITLANTVNIPFSHNTRSNRLFWRVDGNTILGRFYLMHMLCIRPEVTDFVIGSSCDYSFVPEMCPSGNVEAITDSDEFLVIEMQPRQHESAFLRAGPFEVPTLARSLNEWTTSTHRANAQHTLLFHAGELPDKVAESIAAADAFIAQIARELKRRAQPHRGHPYWHGAMAAFYDATGRKLDDEEWRYALGLPENEDWVTSWLLYRAKYALMGRPPHVLPWHPAWPDFQIVLRELRPFFADGNQRLLMLSSEPTPFTLALADGGERVHRFRCVPFLQHGPERYAPLREKFDLCLLELAESDLRYGAELVERIVPLMRKGGRIIVFVVNRHIGRFDDFGSLVVLHSTRFIRPGAVPTEIHFIPANAARWGARLGMFELRMLLSKRYWFGAALGAIGAGCMVCLSLIGNLDALRRTNRLGRTGRLSSFVMRLEVDPPKAEKAPLPLRSEGEARRGSRAVEAASGLLQSERTGETLDSLYARCLELRDTVGLSTLGLTSNRVWYDNPRGLSLLLRRYQVVAKLLAGASNVGEISWSDAFGTRLVVQQVEDVTVYGPDPEVVEDIRARQDERWPLKAELHDIVAAPLQRQHEALFSLDLFEQIGSADEHRCLVNLCGSLTENGMLIVGAPVPRSPQDTPLSTAAGDVNYKTGAELKAFLGHYFSHVSLFAMTGEAIQIGDSGQADYVLAVCTGVHWEVGDLRRAISPSFEICEWKRGGFYVRMTHPNSEPRRIEGFATVADAARWISEQTMDWLRIGRPTSY